MGTDASVTASHVGGSHPHHWLIKPPDGAFSVGHCKRCGVERSFSNSNESASWISDAGTEAVVVRLRRELASRRAHVQLSDEAA
jgi:hypothetical protein